MATERTGFLGMKATLALVLVTIWGCSAAGSPRPGGAIADMADHAECGVWSERYGIIGDDSPKIRNEGGEVWIWAGGEEEDPDPENAKWFDFTGAPMDPGNLQYGLGMDAIPSIDEPVFVSPDHPDLMAVPPSPYRPCERPRHNDEIMVLGHVENGQARAYPLALLDRHEIVNDQANGEPFAVSWCPLADLGAVHNRMYGDEVDEWGVSGYVYENTFFIYDRATESLWYPLEGDEGFTAVSGPRAGEEVPYTLLEPLPLGEWREKHPDTVVLLADRSQVEVTR